MHDSPSSQVVGFYAQPYNEIVKPDQIWPVSKYFLRRWTPYLNPTRFWMVIAARQLAFRLGNKRRFECYDSLLYEEAGASRANFYRIKAELDQANSPISLFVSRQATHYRRQDDVTRPGPTIYYVRLDEVLTPADAAHLATWLQANQPQRRPEAVVELLQDAATQAPAKLLAPALSLYLADPPARFQALTVADVISRVYGARVARDIDVRKAAEALQTHLTGQVYIGTQYFRKYWLNLLGAGPALLITYLRSLCYLNEESGEMRNQVTVTRPELADALGIDRATLFRWLKKIEENTPPGQPFAPFLELLANQKTAANEVESLYRVQLHDPLIAEHLALYHERLTVLEPAPAVQNETHTNTAKGEAVLQNETHTDGRTREAALQNETHTGMNGNPSGLQNETHTQACVANSDSQWGSALQNETTSVAKVDSNKYLNIFLKALEDSGLNTFAAAANEPAEWLQGWTSENNDRSASFARAAVRDLDGFCRATHIQGYRSRRVVSNSGLTLEQLVAWHLYALTQAGIADRARPGYVINQVRARESPPAPFHLLAGLSWELWRVYACLLELPPLAGEYFQNAPGYEIWMQLYGRMRAEELPFGVGEGVAELAALLLEGSDSRPSQSMIPDRRALRSNGGSVFALVLPSDQDRLNWEAALDELELQMTKATFNSWLKGAQLLGRDQDGYVIGVHNGYARDWLASRLYDTVARTLAVIMMQEEVKLRFTVWNPDTDSVRPAAYATVAFAGNSKDCLPL